MYAAGGPEFYDQRDQLFLKLMQWAYFIVASKGHSIVFLCKNNPDSIGVASGVLDKHFKVHCFPWKPSLTMCAFALSIGSRSLYFDIPSGYHRPSVFSVHLSGYWGCLTKLFSVEWFWSPYLVEWFRSRSLSLRTSGSRLLRHRRRRGRGRRRRDKPTDKNTPISGANEGITCISRCWLSDYLRRGSLREVYIHKERRVLLLTSGTRTDTHTLPRIYRYT